MSQENKNIEQVSSENTAQNTTNEKATKQDIKKIKKKLHGEASLLSKIFIFGLPIILVVISVFFSLKAVANNVEVSDANKLLVRSIEDNKKKIAGDMEPYNVAFANDTIKQLLSPADRVYMLRDFYNYTLTANGEKISDATTSVSSGNLVIKLKENAKNTELPLEIASYGSITGGDKNDEIANHCIIKVNSKEKITPKAETKGNEVTLTYSIKAKSGQELNIELNPSLALKLGYSDFERTLTIQ